MLSQKREGGREREGREGGRERNMPNREHRLLQSQRKPQYTSQCRNPHLKSEDGVDFYIQAPYAWQHKCAWISFVWRHSQWYSGGIPHSILRSEPWKCLGTICGYGDSNQGPWEYKVSALTISLAPSPRFLFTFSRQPCWALPRQFFSNYSEKVNLFSLSVISHWYFPSNYFCSCRIFEWDSVGQCWLSFTEVRHLQSVQRNV